MPGGYLKHGHLNRFKKLTFTLSLDVRHEHFVVLKPMADYYDVLSASLPDACSSAKGAAGKSGGRKRGRARPVTLRAAAKAARQLQGSFALRLTDTAQLGVFALRAPCPAIIPCPTCHPLLLTAFICCAPRVFPQRDHACMHVAAGCMHGTDYLEKGVSSRRQVD
jgi:hypothetical protein